MRTALALVALCATFIAVDYFMPRPAPVDIELSPVACALDGTDCRPTSSLLEELSPISSALARPIKSTLLQNQDGGVTTQTARLLQGRVYCAQATDTKTCVRQERWDGGNGANGGGIAVTCPGDWMIPNETNQLPWYCFDTGTNDAIAAGNVDAGALKTQLFLLEKNVSDPYGRQTSGSTH